MIKVKPLVDFSPFLSFFLLCRLMENANISYLQIVVFFQSHKLKLWLQIIAKVRKEAQIASNLGLRLARLGKLCYVPVIREVMIAIYFFIFTISGGIENFLMG